MSQWPSEVGLPAWVTSGAKPTQGVDILGLRAVVQGIGGELLDGITTVTPTVRYLGLRTWVARRYALARLPATDDAFNDFSGRVEAAVAIGNLLVNRSIQVLYSLCNDLSAKRPSREATLRARFPPTVQIITDMALMTSGALDRIVKSAQESTGRVSS